MTDLWLSRITFDPRHREARAAFGDVHAMHRIVMDGFPGITRREDAGALYLYTPPGPGRAPELMVQSVARPDWTFLPVHRSGPPVEVKNVGPFWDGLVAGQRCRFRVAASPSTADGLFGRGRRLPIRDPDRQVEWLGRRLGDAAHVAHVQVSAPQRIAGRKGDNRITLHLVVFSGLLIVTDPAPLRRLASVGIGPGKAYGGGLLAIEKLATSG